MAGRRGVPAAARSPGRHHLAAVADAFLSGADGAVVPGRDGPPAAPPLVTAAPGGLDTGRILAAVAPEREPPGARDLGGRVGTRLGRWERGQPAGQWPASALLLWCPRGEEGLQVRTYLDLGRLAAMLAPQRVTILWLAGSGPAPGRPPDAALRGRVAALAAAAAPDAAVAVHCVGWDAPAERQLGELAARFA